MLCGQANERSALNGQALLTAVDGAQRKFCIVSQLLVERKFGAQRLRALLYPREH